MCFCPRSTPPGITTSVLKSGIKKVVATGNTNAATIPASRPDTATTLAVRCATRDEAQGSTHTQPEQSEHTGLHDERADDGRKRSLGYMKQLDQELSHHGADAAHGGRQDDPRHESRGGTIRKTPGRRLAHPEQKTHHEAENAECHGGVEHRRMPHGRFVRSCNLLGRKWNHQLGWHMEDGKTDDHDARQDAAGQDRQDQGQNGGDSQQPRPCSSLVIRRQGTIAM